MEISQPYKSTIFNAHFGIQTALVVTYVVSYTPNVIYLLAIIVFDKMKYDL